MKTQPLFVKNIDELKMLVFYMKHSLSLFVCVYMLTAMKSKDNVLYNSIKVTVQVAIFHITPHYSSILRKSH